MSYMDNSPSSFIGGSWSAITGRFPYFNAGTNTGGTNFYQHEYKFDYGTYYGVSAGNDTNQITPNKYDSSGNITRGISTYSRASDTIKINNALTTTMKNAKMVYYTATGTTNYESNMPAYQTVYAWRRIA